MLPKLRQFICLLSFISTLSTSSDSVGIVTIEQKKQFINDIEAVNAVERFDINEITSEELDLLAQLVESEAGNQDLTGKRYVVDVVLNRVDSEEFPNSIKEVIFQNNQFTVIENGAFEKATYNVSNESYKAVLLEYDERLNDNILYFSRGKSRYMKKSFKYQDHWFG